MFNRRYLRYKILEALYAFVFSKSKNITEGERYLLESLEKAYELYFYLISFFLRYHEFYLEMLEEKKRKFFPTEEDLNPVMHFANNRLIISLKNNKYLNDKIKSLNINWSNELDIIRKIYLKIKENENYKKYLKLNATNWEQDKKIVIYLYKKYFFEDDVVRNIFEEKNIFWINEYFFINKLVLKTFAEYKEGEEKVIPEMFKDEDDKRFVIELFRKSIIKREEHEKLIASKAQNWDPERILAMDYLIMNMAITEILSFPEIPVKVSFNEYIEVSKYYSTPKSNVFINGILDKIIKQLKEEGKIKKSGRGLIEG